MSLMTACLSHAPLAFRESEGNCSAIRRRNMFTAQDYSRIRCPTLVVWTSHDPTATTAEGQQIASMIPGSKFVVIDNCEHWPQFEAAEAFNRLQLDFFLGNEAIW
jgi:2-hydroxy-6-oxonona-2,4-dienedioate hydrolase